MGKEIQIDKPNKSKLKTGNKVKIKGKRAKEGVAQRQLRLIEKLFKLPPGKSLSFNELHDIYTHEFKLAGFVKKDIANIKTLSIPLEESNNGIGVPPVGIDGLYYNTDIGKRLKEKQDSKNHLAAKVSSFIIKNREIIRRVLLGSGTTVYAVARDMFSCHEAYNIKRVYTANLLVVREYIYRRPPGIQLITPNGEINYNCGVIELEKSYDYFSKLEIEAVIVSFNGIKFEEGFSTGDKGDIDEKLANLTPKNKACKYIIIPMDWSKIMYCDRPIADTREKQLNFQGDRKYIIITNPPSGKMSDKDLERMNDLQKWCSEYKGKIIIL